MSGIQPPVTPSSISGVALAERAAACLPASLRHLWHSGQHVWAWGRRLCDDSTLQEGVLMQAPDCPDCSQYLEAITPGKFGSTEHTAKASELCPCSTGTPASTDLSGSAQCDGFFEEPRDEEACPDGGQTDGATPHVDVSPAASLQAELLPGDLTQAPDCLDCLRGFESTTLGTPPVSTTTSIPLSPSASPFTHGVSSTLPSSQQDASSVLAPLPPGASFAIAGNTLAPLASSSTLSVLLALPATATAPSILLAPTASLATASNFPATLASLPIRSIPPAPRAAVPAPSVLLAPAASLAIASDPVALLVTLPTLSIPPSPATGPAPIIFLAPTAPLATAINLLAQSASTPTPEISPVAPPAVPTPGTLLLPPSFAAGLPQELLDKIVSQVSDGNADKALARR
ncbi:hypothetical protein LTR53_016171 [Teratosphaeriaceae sp. CCFEE 6253]|nr:hypothetical protein LTR53_016171 [Teratosphaeriaceae sp. CCFEE 6253]